MKFEPLFSIFLILFICLVLVFIWFHKGLIFAGGEEGIIFYNLNNTIKFTGYLWADYSTGYWGIGGIDRIPYFTFLFFLSSFSKFQLFLIQALNFLIIMVTAGVSFYLFSKVTIEDELRKSKKLPGFQYVAILGAIFYLLNPFSMTQIWGRSLYMQLFPYALFPLFLLFYALGLKKKNFIYPVLAIISSFIFSGAYGHISYAVSLWFIALLYSITKFLFWEGSGKSIYYQLKTVAFNKVWQKHWKTLTFYILYLLFTFLGWILINMFWLLPFFKLSGDQFASTLASGEENLGSLRGVSKQYPFLNLVRLLHTSYFFEGMYGTIHQSWIFQTISYLIPVISLMSLKIFRSLPSFKFYGPLFLISFFICLGSNFPTGKLFEFIFENVAFFQIYRNPFEKFGLALMIGYSVFFGMGLVVLGNTVGNFFKSKYLFFITILFCLILVNGIYVWPLWTGIFAGGIKINNWIEVPAYYKQANEWLNQQPGNFRLIHYPLLPGDGIKYTWKYSYQGIEPSGFLFDKSSVSRNYGYNKSYYNVLRERFGDFQKNAIGSDPDLSKSEFRSEYLYEELTKLGVRYIVLHNDIDHRLSGVKSSDETREYLSKQDKITKVESFGLLDIYKVEIPDNIELLYSPQNPSTVTKVSPLFYKINLHNVKDEAEIYFLYLFDKKWEAYINGKKIDNHYKVFSYANAWKINQKGENVEIEVKFAPQKYLNDGLKVSLITLIFLVTFSVIFLLRKLIQKFFFPR